MSNARWVDVSEGRDSINPKTGRTYSHTLNRNEKKQSDKEPDYRGMLHLHFSEEVLNIIKHNNGKLSCNLSGWQRDGINGKFLSLQLQHAIEVPEEEEGAVLAGSSEEAEVMDF
jgi:hypothetical protein